LLLLEPSSGIFGADKVLVADFGKNTSDPMEIALVVHICGSLEASHELDQSCHAASFRFTSSGDQRATSAGCVP
jgi:hypothetical protein